MVGGSTHSAVAFPHSLTGFQNPAFGPLQIRVLVPIFWEKSIQVSFSAFKRDIAYRIRYSFEIFGLNRWPITPERQ